MYVCTLLKANPIGGRVRVYVLKGKINLPRCNNRAMGDADASIYGALRRISREGNALEDGMMRWRTKLKLGCQVWLIVKKKRRAEYGSSVAINQNQGGWGWW